MKCIVIPSFLRFSTPKMLPTGSGNGSHQTQKQLPNEEEMKVTTEKKRRRNTKSDLFNALPDDLIICILSKLITTSQTPPSDFINVLMTCKRFNGLAVNPKVLMKASPKLYMVRASNWSESAHRFIKLCADAGNLQACYDLGMIRFYCLQSRASGWSLIAKAAIGSYAPAFYSLAVIQFNGSGRLWEDKDPQAGISFCARAASLGDVDALRELGHCIEDGYGVAQNIAVGRLFIAFANARDFTTTCSKPSETWWSSSSYSASASMFIAEWFEARWGPWGEHEEGMRLCSHSMCGRPETRPREFRRCGGCARARYCSRSCQYLDWKLRHKTECWPVGNEDDDDDVDDDVDDDEVVLKL